MRSSAPRRAARWLVSRAVRSRVLARALFSVDPAPLEEGEHYFDATTLALRRACRRIPPGAFVLDMGTGSAAVLGSWLARRGCRVVASDPSGVVLERARESVRRAGLPVTLVRGAYFEGAPEDLDYVVFNPPYVPTSVGLARGLPERTRSQWDGGPDGTRAVEGFLAAFAREGRGATALLGVNHRHVPSERVLALVGAREEIALERLEHHPFLPVGVYDLVRRKSPIASESRPQE